MTETVEQIWDEYLALCHAMQSGVAAMMNYDPDATNPKHLRVGVNNAMVETGAIAELLMSKGIITKLEFYTALRDKMREEVESYRLQISHHLGGKSVNLV